MNFYDKHFIQKFFCKDLGFTYFEISAISAQLVDMFTVNYLVDGTV